MYFLEGLFAVILGEGEMILGMPIEGDEDFVEGGAGFEGVDEGEDGFGVVDAKWSAFAEVVLWVDDDEGSFHSDEINSSRKGKNIKSDYLL